MLVNRSLLYDETYPLNNEIVLYQPTVREVLDWGEENYNRLVSLFLTYPVDLIVELDDMGFPDFEVFSQYDIFMMLYRSNEEWYGEAMKFFFRESDFVPAMYRDEGQLFLYDRANDRNFDLTSFMIMAEWVRAVHHIPDDPSKTAKKSKMLKRTLLEVERQNAQYKKEQHERDVMAGKVNNYISKSILKLSVASSHTRSELTNMRLYEFYEILNEVVSYHYWQYRMAGVYSGSVDLKKMNKKELEWF